MATLPKRKDVKVLPAHYALWEKWAREGVPSLERQALNFPEKFSPANPRNEWETRVAYYFELANKAFGDKALAKKFMTRKHAKLGMTPVAKLDTEWGGREVESILNSIIYGLPA